MGAMVPPAWCGNARGGCGGCGSLDPPTRRIDTSEEKPRAAATIERYLVHVGWAYRMAGLHDPTADPLVKFERKAARKHLGVRQRQARAIRIKGDIRSRQSGVGGVSGPPDQGLPARRAGSA